jgi:FKBP-type peptidyl-prolyl cis-trans isomerase 2
MAYGNVPARIIDKGDEVSHIDTNHFLAGKDLIFDIKLVEVAENPITKS